LREQRLINKLIVAFTIATVVITVISTIAQMNQIKMKSYIVASVISVGVLTPLGYMLFDPVKQFANKVKRIITRGRRRPHDI
jgi:multisubunit Na+/H+ antiporter MnhB subunit